MTVAVDEGVVVALEAGAVRVAGRWVDSREALDEGAQGGAAGAIALEPALATARLERADRPTRLAAAALGRALGAVGDRGPGDAVGVITASVLASSYTNERFELRRIAGRAPEPRSFPYTAPNAAAGELAIALGARGPSLALVGGAEVGLAALERAARWIVRGRCARVALVAFECPPELAPERLAPRAAPVVECAAALWLAPASHPTAPRRARIAWSPASHPTPAPTPLLSVRALAALWLGDAVVDETCAAGAALRALAT